MRNFLKLVFNRVVIVSLSILLQIIVLLAGVIWLKDYRSWINVALSVLSSTSCPTGATHPIRSRGSC